MEKGMEEEERNGTTARGPARPRLNLYSIMLWVSLEICEMQGTS